MTQPSTAGALYLSREIESAIRSAIDQAQTILCVSHISPDGDAIGSLLGMGWILRHLDKHPTLALADKPAADFDYIPGFGAIVGASGVGDDYDLIICLDASSQDRMGAVYRPAAHGQIPLLVIDHHVTNTNFGSLNWVEPGCAAVCQMLVYLADALGAPLTGDLAVALLTGLITDTLCFRTSNTNAHVLQAAMRLTDGGAQIQEIVARTLQSRTYAGLRLWGSILGHTALQERVIWATISLAQRKQVCARDGDGEGLAGFLVSVKEADIGATFTERVQNGGRVVVECSFRAKPGFDVSQVALVYGGGGHPPAAGCTLTGPLDAVAAQVVAALQEAHRVQVSDGKQAAFGNGAHG
ncbi:MAG: DHH family phosphoesterase [Chloroflexi bacterium]|nr:DHH family phosphoesterase [Chloroflexota bacterium]